ncbi:MAG: tRNA pseudouridine(55) synthase TruB [Bacteroidota bacterium]
MTEQKPIDFNEGAVLVFNKPLGWTSFDLVKKVRNLCKAKKVGHAGTLDPLATGLMILCTGKMTKQIDTFQGQEKEYTGTFTLGVTTASYDREQPVDATFPTAHITADLIEEAVKTFTGKIFQTPPAHSAVKVNGKRAYEIARSGQEAEVKPREVEVRVFEITRVMLPKVDFRVVCSKGTYIRSLVHDLGKHLKSGATLDALCRTRIGEFRIEDALDVADFLRK